MARISQIKNFLGGADQVTMMEILQGEQVQLEIALRDPDGNPIDLTSYDFDIAQEFRRVDIVLDNRTTDLANPGSS